MENSNRISYSMILNTTIGTSKASANCPFGTPIKGLYHSPVGTICPPNGTHLIRTFATKGRPNDLVSNSITQIKNGYSRRFDQVYLPYSKETLQLLEAFLQSGYIQNYTYRHLASRRDQNPLSTLSELSTNTIQSIEVSLKYYQSLPAIKGIQRLSKPNKRLYFSKKKIIQVSQEQNWGEN